MNKKVENAKVDKITDDQLKDLQAHVSRINQTQMALGRLTVQTHELTYLVPQLKKQLKDFQDKLEEQYGKVSININDGTIQEVSEEDGKVNT